MKHRTPMTTIVVIVALVVIATLAVSSRQWIAEQSFKSAGRSLAGKLTPELKTKYGGDLAETLDTFWKCYERKYVSRNDLNDVMEKMSTIRSKSPVEETDVFDFIGYVSRIYTDAIQKHQSDALPE